MRSCFHRCRRFAAFAFAFAGFAATGRAGLVDYLRGHATPLDLRPEAPAWAAGLIDTTGRRIFLLGEVHGVAANYDLDFALLRYFHRVTGVRVYLSEISHAHAWYLNRYLATGDPAILDFLLSQMRGFVDGSEERHRFLVALRAWNLTLPPAGRIRVLGVDLERMPGITLAFLRLQLAPGPIPALQHLLASGEGGQKLAAHLAQAVAAHRAEYATLLGDRWFEVALAVDNLQDYYVCRADKQHFDALRDRVQYRNFLRLADHAPFPAVYGRMGSAHVLRHQSEGIDHFASLLDAPGSQWAGTVVSFWPLYARSRHLSFKSGQAGATPIADDAAQLPPFVAAASTSLTLFRLGGAESPFGTQGRLPAGAMAGVTTDYFDYIILFLDAGPAVPLGKTVNHSSP